MTQIRVVATHIWPREQAAAAPVDELVLDWGGPVGDRHHGETRLADGRLDHMFDKGAVVRNHRQVSIVDDAELAIIAANLAVESLAPGVIADNICTSGLPDLTALPALTRLVFESGSVIVIGGENMPCTIAGALVQAVHGTPPHKFPKAAVGHRGVTGWVERPGSIRPGDTITVFRP